MDHTEKQGLFRPILGITFNFSCHKGLPCFTKCCADLNLVLTPYDIVRIKHCLDLCSGEFLDRYTETAFDHRRFPMAKLRMDQDKEGKCPFVTPRGCAIYENRPGACRIYPLGRAALKPEAGKKAREKFFIVHETHCLGLKEDREWTLEEWMAKEGVDQYNAMNDQWLEIITSPKSLGPEKDIRQKIRMFYMASFNLDTFREFIFKSRFLDLFQVGPALREKLASNDVELMLFAFSWLKFSLYGEKTIQIKSEVLSPS